MAVSVGKGFGLFDFDEYGHINEPRSSREQEMGDIVHEFLMDLSLAQELAQAGINLTELMMSDEEERRQILEEAGLDPDDFDFEDYYPGDDDDDDDDDDDWAT